ncbi:hypothetical protein HC891_12270 [Candidatus Gracilibacteria bacterium]|nr:hypothetical protein [Candidatus Gracilibacteria bacterium]
MYHRIGDAHLYRCLGSDLVVATFLADNRKILQYKRRLVAGGAAADEHFEATLSGLELKAVVL